MIINDYVIVETPPYPTVIIPGTKIDSAQLIAYVQNRDGDESLIFRTPKGSVMYDVEYGFVKPVTNCVEFIQHHYRSVTQVATEDDQENKFISGILVAACSLDSDELKREINERLDTLRKHHGARTLQIHPAPKFKKIRYYSGGSKFKNDDDILKLCEVVGFEFSDYHGIDVSEIQSYTETKSLSLQPIEAKQQLSEGYLEISSLCANAVEELTGYAAVRSSLRSATGTPTDAEMIRSIVKRCEEETIVSFKDQAKARGIDHGLVK